MGQQQPKEQHDVFAKLRLTIPLWAGLSLVGFLLYRSRPDLARMPSGASLLAFFTLVAAISLATDLLTALTHIWFQKRKHPAVEGAMVSRLYRLLSYFAIIMLIAFLFGKLQAFGTFFTMFGGMLLGWSLQAPVSGFAAWMLVTLKRPFRPGDRVQFPNLGLTGDVHEIGPMYTILNQVGGSIGSEEASGRHILVPNALLFQQVAINYTMRQEAAYMLDEVVVRITYDSDWDKVERILLDAARQVTPDIIASTGVEPYIRSDNYDYGVYMRLRYMTRVKDRPYIAYQINKQIFKAFQHDTTVDFAIPYVYSYRAASGRKEDELGPHPQEMEIAKIISPAQRFDQEDVAQLMESIRDKGLLQPIVLVKSVRQPGMYEVVAGGMRFEACRRLGWKTVAAVIDHRSPAHTA